MRHQISFPRVSAFHLLLAAVALIAGVIASVVGFGIGSLLTPFLALQVGTKLAVAAVSVPHAAATALRFWMLRAHLDRRVLVSFGVASAAGGLAGALMHAYAGSPALTLVFGLLLLLAGTSELTGLSRRVRLGRPAAWAAGALSGLFGGLVGNQGGIRSAAMLAFDVPRDAFVATATAIALIVDAARMPVYFATAGSRIAAVWPAVVVASVGTIAGTLLGRRVLAVIPEPWFRRLVAVIVLLLGVYMVWRAGA